LLSELTVIADPTKWHKPNPPSCVDSCVPHHYPCPPPPRWLSLSLLLSSWSSSLIAHAVGQ
jgi:hypothetical protein